MSRLTPRLFMLMINSFITKEEQSIYGINYTITLDEDGLLNVNFTNPNDLSYNQEVLFGIIEEKINEFFKYVGSEWNRDDFNEVKSKLVYYMDGRYLKQKSRILIYLNTDDKNNIKRLAKTINVFEWDSNGDPEAFYSPVELSDIKVVIESEETVAIDFKVMLLNPEYTDDESGKHDNMSLQFLGEVFNVLYDNDTFYEYVRDRFADSIIDFLWNNPLIIDDSYMILTAEPTFYTKEGMVKSW